MFKVFTPTLLASIFVAVATSTTASTSDPQVGHCWGVIDGVASLTGNENAAAALSGYEDRVKEAWVDANPASGSMSGLNADEYWETVTSLGLMQAAGYVEGGQMEELGQLAQQCNPIVMSAIGEFR